MRRDRKLARYLRYFARGGVPIPAPLTLKYIWPFSEGSGTTISESEQSADSLFATGTPTWRSNTVEFVAATSVANPISVDVSVSGNWAMVAGYLNSASWGIGDLQGFIDLKSTTTVVMAVTQNVGGNLYVSGNSPGLAVEMAPGIGAGTIAFAAFIRTSYNSFSHQWTTSLQVCADGVESATDSDTVRGPSADNIVFGRDANTSNPSTCVGPTFIWNGTNSDTIPTPLQVYNWLVYAASSYGITLG